VYVENERTYETWSVGCRLVGVGLVVDSQLRFTEHIASITQINNQTITFQQATNALNLLIA